MEASTSHAQTRWELENHVRTEDDELLNYEDAEQKRIRQQAPWKNDPRYFQKCARRSAALGWRGDRAVVPFPQNKFEPVLLHHQFCHISQGPRIRARVAQDGHARKDRWAPGGAMQIP
jgi:hypothetical protein